MPKRQADPPGNLATPPTSPNRQDKKKGKRLEKSKGSTKSAGNDEPFTVPQRTSTRIWDPLNLWSSKAKDDQKSEADGEMGTDDEPTNDEDLATGETEDAQNGTTESEKQSDTFLPGQSAVRELGHSTAGLGDKHALTEQKAKEWEEMKARVQKTETLEVALKEERKRSQGLEDSAVSKDSELKTLKEQVQSVTKALEEAKQTAMAKDRELKKTEEKSLQDIADLEKKLHDWEARYKTAKGDLGRSAEATAELKRKLEEEKSRAEGLVTSLSAKETELKESLRKYESIKVGLGAKLEELKAAKGEAERAKELDQEVQVLRKENNDLEDNLASLMEQMNTALAEAAESSEKTRKGASNEQTTRELEDALAKAEEWRLRYETAVRTHQSEVQRIHQDHGSLLERYQAEVGKKNQELQVKEKECKDMRTELVGLREGKIMINGLTAQLKAATGENVKIKVALSSQTKKAEEAEKALTGALDAYGASQQLLEKAEKKYVAEIEELRLKLLSVTEKAASHQAEVVALQGQMNEGGKEREGLSRVLEATRGKVASLKKDLAEVTASWEDTSALLVEQKRKLERKSREYEAAEKDVQGKQQRIRSLEQSLQDWMKNCDNITKSKDAVAKQLAAMVEQQQGAVALKAALEARLEEKTIALQQAVEEIERNREAARAEMEEATRDLNARLDEALRNADATEALLVERTAQFDRRLQEAVSQYTMTEASWAKNKGASQEQLMVMKRELEVAKALLVERTAECDRRLDVARKDFENAKALLAEKVKVLERRIQDETKERHVLQALLSEKEKEYRVGLGNASRALADSRSLLEERTRALEIELQKSREDYEVLKALQGERVGALERELTELRDDGEEREKAVAELDSENEQLWTECQKLRLELETKEKEVKGAWDKSAQVEELEFQLKVAIKDKEDGGRLLRSKIDELVTVTEKQKSLEHRFNDLRQQHDAAQAFLEKANRQVDEQSAIIAGLELQLSATKENPNDLIQSTPPAVQAGAAPKSRQEKVLLAQLRETTRKLESAQELLNIRKQDVALAQDFLITADTCSTAEILRAIESLNDDIFQCAKFISDALYDEEIPTQSDGEYSERRQLLETKYGAETIFQMRRSLVGEEGDWYLFECIVQALLVEWCIDIACSLKHGGGRGRDFSRFVDMLWEGIRRTKGLAIAKNWLAIAHSQARAQDIDPAPVVSDMQELLSILGWGPSSPESMKVARKLLEKVTQIKERALAVKAMSIEGMLSMHVRPFHIPPGTVYNPAVMVDDEFDGQEGKNQVRQVVCSTSVGLTIEAHQQSKEDGRAEETDTILKPKVVSIRKGL